LRGIGRPIVFPAPLPQSGGLDYLLALITRCFLRLLSMQLAPTRFVEIVGNEVRVTVNSSADARIALKELKHKKRELSHLRKGLIKRQQALRKQQNRATRPRSLVWQIFDRRKKLVQAVTAVVSVFRPRRPVLNASQIESELCRIDDLQHGINSCVLQIEGKLIGQS
jgi:hypothetical protein